ncbi:hypothetical protein F988_00939, partial [Acinetobacter parvus DSM 16617 = CIP 108168]
AINKKQLDSEVLTLNTRIDNLPTGGSTPIASDNYAHTSTDTALGSAKGTPHATTTTTGKITAVGGITVTTDLATAGISIDDINSFTVGGVITTKAADPAKVAAFINAAKKGGNIAVGINSSAMGTANIASGDASSAVGYSNTVVSNFGNGNNAFGSYNKNHGQFFSTAMGVGNIVSDGTWGTNAIGYSNTVSGLGGSALGTANTVKTTGSNAVGFNNLVSGGYYANAFGTGNTAMGQNTAAVGSGLAFYNGSYNQQVSLTPAYTPTMISVGGVTALDGVVIETTAANWLSLQVNPSLLTKVNGQVVTAAQAANIVKSFEQGGNLALADRSSVFGINSKAVATGATAIGLNSVADEANTISVGRAGATKRITNVATPVNATDATNKAYVDTALSNFTANADTVLYDTASNQATLTLAGASGTKITNLQNATLSDTSTDAVTGQQLKATNDVVAGKASQTDLTTGLAAKADKTAFDSLNNKVTDAATGLDSKASTTALTTGLSSTLADAKGYTDQTATTTLASAKGYTDQTATTTLTNAKTYADQQATTLDGKITTNTTAISTLDGRVTTEVGTLNTAITNSANTINTRIDGVDTRIGNEVTTLNTKIGTEVGTLNNRITNEVGTLNTTISGIDGRVTTNTNDIALLKTNTGNLAANAVI